jgi:histidinol-phosphate aminotransferase
MHPYQPGKPISTVKRELGLDHVIKLASNENPFGPSPKALEAIREALPELHLYPDGASFDLRTALAEKFETPFNQVVVGNGSDELIGAIGLALLSSPDDEVITAEHSFPRYDAAVDLAPGKLIKAEMSPGWRYDLSAISRAVTANTKIIFIANPNNPTGTIVRKRELDAFIADLPSQTLLVLDEAYFEFAQDAGDYPDGREYVLAGKNVVALRTFSKIYGLAGLRIGYGFVPAYIADAFDRVRAPFDVNSLAQAGAIGALGDAEFLNMTLANNRSGLKLMQEAVEAAGCEVTESWTNFHFIDLKRPCMPVFQALLERGIITRPCTGYGAPNHLRVSIGTPDENETFAREFKRVME